MNYSDWHYVEVAKYVPKFNAVIREKKDDEAVMLSVRGEIGPYRKRYHNKGLYTSIFRYDAPSLDAPRMSALYFDLDAEDHLEIAHQDVRLLYNYLQHNVPSDIIRVYFSGSKGFHVEVSARALGVSPYMDLARVFRLIAEDARKELKLETLDFAVYEPRRMWRMPNSRHQKTGLYKVVLTESEVFGDLSQIMEISQQQRAISTREIHFNPQANEWFKSYITRREQLDDFYAESAASRRLQIFKKYGKNGLLNGPSQKYIKKLWESAIEALKEAEANKERNTTLSRQAYKLYINHLKADIDLDTVTNRLYDIGIGIGLEDREVRATLRSAQRAAARKHEENVGSEDEQQTRAR